MLIKVLKEQLNKGCFIEINYFVYAVYYEFPSVVCPYPLLSIKEATNRIIGNFNAIVRYEINKQKNRETD